MCILYSEQYTLDYEQDFLDILYSLIFRLCQFISLNKISVHFPWCLLNPCGNRVVLRESEKIRDFWTLDTVPSDPL